MSICSGPYNLKLTKMDTDSVYIGRPSKYGNKFKIKGNTSREEVIRLFENDFTKSALINQIGELKGKNFSVSVHL